MIESDEINMKIPVRESARYWFKRPAYAAFELKRGDTDEQEHSE